MGCGAHPGQATRTPRAPGSDAASDAASAASSTDASIGDGPAPATRQPRVIDLEPIRIEVVGRDGAGRPHLDAFDARTLLDEGNAAMAEERYDAAIVHYEKLLAVFPDSRLAPAAIYNIGLAYEGKGDYDAAIRQYRILAGDEDLDRDAVEAAMRVGGLLAELERWTEARQALQEVLARPDLTHDDTIEGMARLGYVALEQKDYATAEAVLRDAIAYYKKLTSSLDSDYFVAMSHYYLAQIPHRQFLALPMRLPDEQLQKDLQAKAELVALAYDRYLQTTQLHNVYWGTAAGYQLSQIYKELWDHIVLAPVPTHLSPDAARYYVREVHERVRVFLENALEGHSKNVEMARAYKTSTVWSEASRTRADAIAEILARESSGELVTPEAPTPLPSADRAGGDREYMPGRVEL